MKKTTELNSLYNNLNKIGTLDILTLINKEDQKVAHVVHNSIQIISKLVEVIVNKLSQNGRLFYVGSGTSGRLGILDASECPPTFGVSQDKVIGIIAGGDKAIKKAVESAEDNTKQCWNDLQSYRITNKDVVIGISASGTTPYVLGGLRNCQENHIFTASITCNKNSPISKYSDIPIEILVGPEFITGSTRMKSGTAQKLTLNMISTAVMIKLGHVLDNKMVDMQIKNEKLKQRAINMIMEMCHVSNKKAKALLEKFGNVRNAINNYDT
ncbi:MAG: N-acetylmuramic acid 6-phosphate etherase [Flavobacteriales bacterium]|nr:N-acetylmuramic acid 6-phosphate etherase [Flavobacteriales bacterium]|tara:strand:+ start:3204 stop:4010 length:807 start_codon:yes stop_codon:yes gene_type:complete